MKELPLELLQTEKVYHRCFFKKHINLLALVMSCTCLKIDMLVL